MNKQLTTSKDALTLRKDKILTHRSNVQMTKLSKSLSINPTINKSPSQIDKNYIPEEIKLPTLKLRKVLGKIGAMSKRQSTYVPPEDQQKAFRLKKMKELKDSYPFATKKRSEQPFKFQLDQIVLDCFQHGQHHGKKTVWRKYRRNMDSLSFDTMKVLHKK